MKRLSTRKWIVGVGSVVMAVVLVLVGTLRNVETLDAKGIFQDVETLRDKLQNNGQVYTILEIIPDNGDTALSYLVGEQEPYSDGDFGTTNDFNTFNEEWTVEKQDELVDDLLAREIMTEDETSSTDYPLYYTYDSYDDIIFSVEVNPELVEAGYTTSEAPESYLVPGTFREAADTAGNVYYIFTPQTEILAGDIDSTTGSAYITNPDGTNLYLTFDPTSGNYVLTTTVSGGDAGEGGETGTGNETVSDNTTAKVIEGNAYVASSALTEGESGLVENSESVSDNTEVPQPEIEEPEVETPDTEKPEAETPDTEKPEAETPGTEEPTVEEPETEETPAETPGMGDVVTNAVGDYYEGYGYLSGYLYTKLIDEHTVRNNEFFKAYVFDMLLDDVANFSIDVVTKTVSEVTEKDVENANMFYIQGGDYCIENVSGDMNADVARALLGKVAEKKPEGDTSTDRGYRYPCIIDYSIYENLNQANTNSYIYKLAMMMMAEDMPAAYDYIKNNKVDWNADANSDGWKSVRDYIPATIPNNGHFVNDNVYFVSGIKLVSDDFVGYYFTEDEIANGFTDVYNAISREKHDNPDSEFIAPEIINPSIVIQYLINFASDSLVIKKTQIRVLELQPCKTFNWDTETEKAAFVKKYLDGVDSANVTIDCMTTMEFVGKNVNLNATYDLIYIGTNIDNYKREVVNLNEPSNLTSDTNLRRWVDENMKGLVYSHVGDLTEWNVNGDNGVGLLESDYSNNQTADPGMVQLRLPGNDISSHNRDALIEYLKSGYPIIVSDWFFTYGNKNYTINIGTGHPDDILVEGNVTGINGGNSYAVDAGNPEYWNGRYTVPRNIRKWQITTPDHVKNGTNAEYEDYTSVRYGILDTSTYLYQVIKEAWNPAEDNWTGREYKNLVNQSGADTAFMNTYVNKQKLSLNLTQVPTKYSYTTKGDYEVIRDIQYLMPGEDGKYNLNYEFSISNLDSLSSPSDRYKCQLYIDDNFDGKFSKTQEEVSELTIVEAATGKVVAYNDLKAGVPYTLTRQLPADYVGCIQWQLLISLNGNEYIQCEEIGMTAVKSNKEKINVLHIMDYNGWSVNLEQELKRQTSDASAWTDALNNIPDFEINIKSVTLKEYIDQLERYLWPKVRYGQDIRVYPTPEDFFNEYIFGSEGTDMILMGFYDSFDELNHDVAINAIMNYAESGRSVLFSHDMTSWMSKYRQRSGTDRMYMKLANGSITANTGNNKFREYTYGTDGAAEGSEYFGIRIREATGMDMFGATVDRFKIGWGASTYANSGQGYSKYKDTEAWNYLESLGKDMAFKANTEQTETVGQTTGGTYILSRDSGISYILDDNAMWRGTDKTQVTQVNDGVITSYPYEIKEVFEPAITHSQYYALDMEEDADGDGESDLVVWYCVATNDKDDKTQDALFDISPNDVRNNYYIYSMGNVIYTGMGHTVLDKERSKIYVEEVKLFINTMVAAYRAGVKTPDVTIVESGDEGADKVDFIAMPYDNKITAEIKNGNEVDTTGFNETKVDVYFNVNDNNVIKGTKQIVSEFYIDGSEVAFENVSVYDCSEDTEKKVEAYVTVDNKNYYLLESGKTYRLQLGLTDTQIANTCEVEIRVYARVEKKNNIVNTSEKAIDRVKVSKVDMFDLD